MTVWKIVSVLAAVTATVGCQRTLDAKELEQQAKTRVTAADGTPIVLVSASCPSGRPSKSGEKFSCTGKMQDGEELTVNLTVLNDDGLFELKPDGAFLTESAIGGGLEKKGHGHADVTCPQKAVRVRPGKSFSCDAVFEGKKHKVDVLFDAQGMPDWKVSG
jgi:hypothetical protein